MNGSRPARSHLHPGVGLVIGVVAVSTASTMIRLVQSEADSLAVAAWRMALAALILAPFALTARRAELRSITRREWGLALGAGSLLAIHFAAWITSLALTSVAASVVLVTLYPLFVGLASHLFMQERLSGAMVAGLLIATAGSVVIALGDVGKGTHRLLGDLLALAGALAAAGYFLIGRRLRARLSLLGYVFPVYSMAAALLLITAALARVPLTGYSPGGWLLLLALALVPQIVGHSSLNWALRHLSATYVTLVVLGEPVGSTLLAWLVLHEVPGVTALIGGGLALIGIMVASRVR